MSPDDVPPGGPPLRQTKLQAPADIPAAGDESDAGALVEGLKSADDGQQLEPLRAAFELGVGSREALPAADALATLSLGDPLVVSSPRKRALVTAELAGLKVDEVSPLLSEWDYGDYEGLTTAEIRRQAPDWLVWTHGCPGGESLQQVSDRADRAIAMSRDELRKARTAAVLQAFFIGAALLVGAAVAWLTAVEGGKDRETGTFFAWPARKQGIRQV